MNRKFLLALTAVSILLNACSSKPVSSSSSRVEVPATPSVDEIENSQTTHSESKFDAHHVVFFDLNSSEIKPAAAQVISEWAKHLRVHPGIKVRVEGNADERGAAGYNVDLAERRANAVAKALQAQGVPAAQLTVISNGGKHPAVSGHDEAAWSQNRRVELRY